MKSIAAICAFRAILLAALVVPPGFGATQSPTFATATITRSSSESQSGGVQLQAGGVLTVTNTAPRDMIRTVFNLPDVAVVGGPDWLESERYDIVANANRDLTRAEAAQMLKALLIERFKLRLREETRQDPAYELAILTSDGRLGPGLTPTRADCAAAERAGTGLCRFDLAGGSITGTGTTMARLVRALGGLTGRVVIDKTGLAGNYDLNVTWTPGAVAGPAGPGSPLFNALEEQLGLQLVDALDAAPVLIIESAERPTE